MKEVVPELIEQTLRSEEGGSSSVKKGLLPMLSALHLMLPNRLVPVPE